MVLDFSFIITAFLSLLKALPNTLYITIVSVSSGFVIGTIIALIRVHRVPVLAQIAAGYVMFIRGTPMLMHLLLIYFGLPKLLDGVFLALGLPYTSTVIPLIGFAYISFSITASAYMSEIVRSGISAIDRGQLEAAYSIGMSTVQAFQRIIMPQALAVSLPNLSNSLIGMLHGSTLAFTVSVVEINAQAQIVAATNWKFLEAYIAAAILFWGLTVLIERLAAVLERKIARYNRGGVT